MSTTSAPVRRYSATNLVGGGAARLTSNTLRSSLGLLAVLFMSAFVSPFDASSQVVWQFAVPGTNPRGLAWGGTNLWIVNKARTVYQVNTNGQVLSSFPISFDPSGMAWDGTNFWIGDEAHSRQVKIGPQGNVLGTLNIWYWFDSGIAWDGTNFWAGDYNFAEMHKHDAAGNSLLVWSCHQGGIEHPTGIVFDGANLWVGDPNEGFSNNVARFTMSGQLLNSFNTVNWGIPPVTWPEFKTLAWDGRYLWYSADDLLTIYKVDSYLLLGITNVVPPTIVLQPTDQSVWAGTTATLTAGATGTMPLRFQWWSFSSGAMSGATNATLVVSNVQPPNAGYYWVVVTNVAGSAISAPAMLSVAERPLVLHGAQLLGGVFRFAVDVVPGSSYSVEASTNLVNWTPLLTTNVATDSFAFSEGQLQNTRKRFYRVLKWQ